MSHRKRLDKLEGIAPDQSVDPVTAVTFVSICPKTQQAIGALTWPMGPNRGEQINHSARMSHETETEFLARVDLEISELAGTGVAV